MTVHYVRISGSKMHRLKNRDQHNKDEDTCLNNLNENGSTSASKVLRKIINFFGQSVIKITKMSIFVQINNGKAEYTLSRLVR